jgi:hypothetical protein
MSRDQTRFELGWFSEIQSARGLDCALRKGRMFVWKTGQKTYASIEN